MGELTLQPAVFAIFSRLIEERAGLHYQRVELEQLARRLSPRARELGFDSLLDYYYFLRHDPKGAEELEHLVEALPVHETYFFRESDQLRVLVDTFLAPMVEAGQRPKVWCAAVASGEEAYTLAMMLGERGLLEKVDLIASDLSRRLLSHASQGLYSGRALRAVAGTIAYRWLETEGEQMKVPAALRAAIVWRRINLIEGAEVDSLGRFDAILCRNVLIYFSDSTTTRVVRQLTAALNPGGLLMVGGSESLMLHGTSLECVERSGAFFYRKSA